jgi:SAM-dependent methyltransferase
MLAFARSNAARAGLLNARFVHGRIEDIPLPDGSVDVVISNCVVNLSADKPRVLSAAFRVLRAGGRLGITDIIADENLDPRQQAAAEQLVGCASGTLAAAEYGNLLTAAGFTGVGITITSHAGGGLRSTIVQALKPAPAAEAQAPSEHRSRG